MSAISRLLGFDEEAPSKGTVIPSSTSGGFDDTNFYSALLTAGVGLAGTYLKQSGEKDLAEQAAEQRMKELAYAAANQKGGGGGGGGGSGSAMKIAKMNNLSALYQNYAQIMSQADDDERAIQTGQLMTNPINARAGRL